jgi:hypothetical protein
VDTSRSPVPAWLINLVVKYLLGLLFYKQAQAAKRMIAKPKGNAHVSAIENRAYFYRDWLLPKVEATIEALRQRLE